MAFQEFHDELRLHARKRLYMTATPRIYTDSSKRRLAERGIDVVDMDDQAVYGPELHRLLFKKAVERRMLSDYRVIVLGVSEASVTPGLRRRLEGIGTAATRRQAVGGVEAKPDARGERITTVEEQSERYANAELKWVSNTEPHGSARLRGSAGSRSGAITFGSRALGATAGGVFSQGTTCLTPCAPEPTAACLRPPCPRGEA